MRDLVKKRNVIIRSMLLLLVSVALLGCVEARYNTRPSVIMGSHTHVVHIPGTYVYVVPDIDAEVFFYGGSWYSYHDNYWFRASVYSGPWVSIRIGNVPPRLHRLPGHYRHHIHSNSHRIDRSELRKHWKSWERDRRWERDGDRYKYKGKKHKKRSGYYKKGHDDGRPLFGAIKEKVERQSGSRYDGSDRGDYRRSRVEPKKDYKKKVKYYKKGHDAGRSLAGAVNEEVERRSKKDERKISARDSRRYEDEKKNHKKKDKKKRAKKRKEKKDRDGDEYSGDDSDDSKKGSKGKAKRYKNERGGGNSFAGAILRKFEKK